MGMISGLNTKTVEVIEDIQINMSIDEAYALLGTKGLYASVAHSKLYKVLEAALVQYEDEIKPQTVCEAA